MANRWERQIQAAGKRGGGIAEAETKVWPDTLQRECTLGGLQNPLSALRSPLSALRQFRFSALRRGDSGTFWFRNPAAIKPVLKRYDFSTSRGHVGADRLADFPLVFQRHLVSLYLWCEESQRQLALSALPTESLEGWLKTGNDARSMRSGHPCWSDGDA